MAKNKSATTAVLDAPENLDTASAPFIGQWQKLVSTTNWEKGRIIQEWREALERAGALITEYSDEAWAQRVGGVTGQHAGRLRRTYERFGKVWPEYDGLYWSHFQIALDWEDAEMWLEGAVQNNWSISQMRNARWEAIGAPADQQPREQDIYVGQIDEDAYDLLENKPTLAEVRGFDAPAASREVASEDEEYDDTAAVEDDASSSAAVGDDAARNSRSPIRPFENLADLPADLAEAFEQYKLAILHHKLAGWQEISRADVLASLDALKQLALAPSEG